ncbi:hypothetical protein [Paenarthrobacter sp. YJN-5]|uniref:hypothetical protein n=1 Tax=Paenarthrobacter sp. YJN-5 TaxID=2735316 RepID=UPI001878729E|nr:hypothetical protein [Paenarthrobacter sp. YJN-5]QOT19221.1 hypothetical protein HMI59_21145 [Paenarthrobacter sp. YJN-5]
MSQGPAPITIDQLRNREISATDLPTLAPAEADRRQTIITAPSEPVSVFGRKLAGHDA